jgi:4-amino-4-deoxy-L-arabinose transferase-like glycosyltransferase
MTPPSFLAGLKPAHALGLWLAICALAFSYKLSALPPYHTDESYYVESVKTMVNTGDYLTPVYHGNKRFAKPILIYWLMAVAYKVFGFSAAVARLWSVVFGVLSVGLVFLLARRLFDPDTAILSAFIYPGFFLHFQISRWATTDMALNFFVLAAIYYFVCGIQEPAKRKIHFSRAYIAMSLGFMTKGPPALLLPLLAVLPFLWIAGQREVLKNLSPFTGILIFTVIVAPWFAAMFYLHGDEYWRHLKGAEFEERVFNKVDFGFYFLGVSVRYYLPWSLFFLSALGLHVGLIRAQTGNESGLTQRIKSRIVRLREPEQRPVLFCILWFVGTVILFTLFRIQHSRYILPASPAIAMLLGHFFAVTLTADAFSRFWFQIPYAFTVAMFLVVPTVSGAGIAALHTLSPLPAGALLFFVVLIPILMQIRSAHSAQDPKRLAVAIAAGQLILMTLINGELLPHFNQYPMKVFAGEIRETARADEPVAVYQLDNQRPKLEVLSAHSVVPINDAGALRRFVERERNAYVVMKESDWRTEFENLQLDPVAYDFIWKKDAVRWEALTEIRQGKKGIGQTLAEAREKLVLLRGK